MKKNSSLFKSILIISCILLVAILTFPLLIKKVKYGLDLQGGFEILYKVDSLDGSEVTEDMVTNTYKTILKRIDSLGVNEPVIIVEGKDRIRVQLAGVTDEDEARTLLGKQAVLTFRDVYDNELMTSDVLSSASVDTSDGKPVVSLKVKDTDKFYEVTKKVSEYDNNSNYIVIWLDYDKDKDSFLTYDETSKELKLDPTKCNETTINNDHGTCISAATVNQGFASDVVIQGNFTVDQASTLAELINSGSLSTKLSEISSKTVPASYGDETLSETYKAAVIGLILVVVVMTLIYRLAGFLASVGILLYTYLTVASFVLLGGVLTLPGIAALVIGIGMAIDAPVISLSRIKDELRKGKNLVRANSDGNKESFMSIFDANITTLIVAIILFILGESSVKGFATMLIISIVVTMLVMVYLTRVIISMFVNTKYFNDKLNLFIGYKNDKKPFEKLDFVASRIYAYIIVLLVVMVGVYSLCTNKLKLGIDFKGGTSITFNTEEKINYDDVTNTIKDMGYEIYESEKVSDTNIYYKLSNSLDESEIAKINSVMEEKYNTKPDIGVVSNVVSKELVKNAVKSIIFAFIAIIIYVAIRFTFNYAIGGIVAIMHDVFIMIAFFSLFKLEVDAIFIAALLSIIGYSINDTIVTFDRMREIIKTKYNNKLKNKKDCADVVNTALRNVLGRSIVTTFTTLCPVVALIIFGSSEIINFNIALLVGMIAGVLSSIFLACQIWYELTKNNIKKEPKKHWLDDEKEELKIKGINS